MTLADWIRSQVVVDGHEPTRREPKRIHPKPVRIPHGHADLELLRQIARIGNNVNQIARRLNSRNDIPNSVAMEWLMSLDHVMNELLKVKENPHDD